jgi:Holliday junction resolvasome RuvABC endonuclease subunit
MDTEQLKAHVDSRFDRLETKIDSHLERLSKAEVAIEFIRGHLKISTAIALGIAGALGTWWFNYVTQ